MSVTVESVLELLSRLAPIELAQSWDNVGLLVNAGEPVERILTTLDITPAVVREAAELGCQLIVSHHPVIFGGLKRLSAQDVPGMLLKQGISAICMHTNLDAAEGGVNDMLATLLGVQDTEIFADGCGRIGTVKPVELELLAGLCRKTLGPGVKLADASAGEKLTRVAVVSGAGGSYWEEAAALGAQCLVTGEASHHHACDALQRGMSLIVAGHWATERPMAGVLAKKLAAALPEVAVSVSQADRDPFTYLY